MAIYHLRASVISRSAGRSATGAAAYRAAERIEDRRTGISFDYAAKAGVDHVEILAPDHSPDWVYDRAELWNRVEAAETRKNSQVAREIRIALPAELDHGQRVDLVRGFVQAQFVDRGMVADIALHAPGREGDERNHHAHILLTTREVDGGGFTTKNRDWNKVELLEGWREVWARDSNTALERADVEARVDHRTLVAQRDEALELAEVARERGDEGAELRETVRAMSLDRKPLPQLSPGAWQLKERGIDVMAVRAWREIKEQASIVAREVRELAGHVRSWLDRTMGQDMVRGRQGDGLAYAGADGGDDDDAPGLAARLRAAWEDRERDGGKSAGLDRGSSDERELPRDPDDDSAQSLAERLRQAATGVDMGKVAERAAELQRERQAEEQHRVQAERKQARELEQERKEELARTRDRGPEYGL